MIVDLRYAGYMDKQAAAMKHMQDLDAKLVPDDVDYASVTHLRHEAAEKLTSIRPRTLGQALRISGITPADVTVLSIWLATGKLTGGGSES